MPAVRCRVALIGASCRAMYAYARPLLEAYSGTHELVGMYDIAPQRMKALNDFLGSTIPAFDDPQRLYREARPDLVVISTIDATHVDYLEQALSHGASCVCEKPLCTTAEHCARIRRAQAARPDLFAVTAHNYRYAPANQTIRALLAGQAIGALRSVSYHELLDHRHGASYFRRWNRRKANSGGLLVHKASHCFDLINWWVGSRAVQVVARGALTAYGPAASAYRGERCCDCAHAGRCPRHADLTKDSFRGELYFRARTPGSYTPDLCLFSPEIDIEDHACVSYACENGVQVSFELCAHAAYEGVMVAIEGSTGRLEFQQRLNTQPLEATAEHGTEKTLGESLRIYRFGGPTREIPIRSAHGGHGGADEAMLRDLFGGRPGDTCASLEDGIQAVLIGAAANRSIAAGRPVDVQAMA